MNWLVQSRKAQVAIGGVLTIVLSRLLKHFGFSDSDINVISGSVLTVATIWIHSIAHEDAAAKSGPQNQTNVNSDVRNAQPAPIDKPKGT